MTGTAISCHSHTVVVSGGADGHGGAVRPGVETRGGRGARGEDHGDRRPRRGDLGECRGGLGDALALKTVRPRLRYDGLSARRNPYGWWDGPEDADHPGHAVWLRDHAFNGLRPAGDPFQNLFPPRLHSGS